MKTQPHAPNSRSTNEAGAGDPTTVELLWLEKRIENRVRFGRIPTAWAALSDVTGR